MRNLNFLGMNPEDVEMFKALLGDAFLVNNYDGILPYMEEKGVFITNAQYTALAVLADEQCRADLLEADIEPHNGGK